MGVPRADRGELVDYLRVDICHSGGITEGRKIAAMGEVHYQELACHYTASPVSTAAMLHLNLAVPNCAVQEYSPPAPWMNEVIEHDLRTEDGFLLRSDAPGLGIDLNEEAAAAYPHSGTRAAPPAPRGRLGPGLVVRLGRLAARVPQSPRILQPCFRAGTPGPLPRRLPAAAALTEATLPASGGEVLLVEIEVVVDRFSAGDPHVAEQGAALRRHGRHHFRRHAAPAPTGSSRCCRG